jgi:hypothetical protein
VESNHKFYSKRPKTPPVTFLWTGVCEGTGVRLGKKLVVVRELRNLGIEKKNFISREASKVAIHMMTRHSAKEERKKEETTHHSPWLDESEK